MKRNRIKRHAHLLVARMQGNDLRVNAQLREELGTGGMQRIEALQNAIMRCTSDYDPRLDELATRLSAEWERRGNLLWASGQKTQAMQAYRNSMLSCTEGVYYDYGMVHSINSELTRRFWVLMDQARELCGANEVLFRAEIADDADVRYWVKHLRRARRLILDW